jgi:hypothetical protein
VFFGAKKGHSTTQIEISGIPLKGRIVKKAIREKFIK